MCAVGEHALTRERVAIKVMQRAVLRQAHMGAAVRREIDILSKLDHPNIIRL